MEYYTCLDSGERYFDAAMLARLQTGVGTFLASYGALASECAAQNSVGWRMVPKHHMMEHLSDTVAPQVAPSGSRWVQLDGGPGCQFAGGFNIEIKGFDCLRCERQTGTEEGGVGEGEGRRKGYTGAGRQCE